MKERIRVECLVEVVAIFKRFALLFKQLLRQQVNLPISIFTKVPMEPPGKRVAPAVELFQKEVHLAGHHPLNQLPNSVLSSTLTRIPIH